MNSNTLTFHASSRQGSIGLETMGTPRDPNTEAPVADWRAMKRAARKINEVGARLASTDTSVAVAGR